MNRIPWKGAGRPLSPDAFAKAAAALGCEEAAIRAVWEKESGGRAYLPDGSLIRRFEPHHMPGSTMHWRDSLDLDKAERERLFREAWSEAPNAALRASSWGAPQIMGFNAEHAGFASAREMVEAMADSEDAHIEGFVAFVKAEGFDAALRAKDWQAFALYNGSGQPEKYGRSVERIYRRLTGRKSPQVLRVGSQGEAVRRLQRGLGIMEDGVFGGGTEAAVRAFQEKAGLPVDGIVGARTWAALESHDTEKAPAQDDTIDKLLDRGRDVTGLASGASAAASPILDRLTDNMMMIVLVFAGVAGLMALGFWLVRRARSKR